MTIHGPEYNTEIYPCDFFCELEALIPYLILAAIPMVAAFGLSFFVNRDFKLSKRIIISVVIGTSVFLALVVFEYLGPPPSDPVF